MKNYSFTNTVLLVNGVNIDGWADGDDVITAERAVDSALSRVGAYGEMTVAVVGDRSGTITFNLMQNSDSNTYLSGIVLAMENSAFVPVFVQWKDLAGGDLISGTQGFIHRPSTLIRGVGVNVNEWMITTERLDILYT